MRTNPSAHGSDGAKKRTHSTKKAAHALDGKPSMVVKLITETTRKVRVVLGRPMSHGLQAPL